MKDRRLIVVLGMHRSGTSAITRGLQTIGVGLGDRFLPTMTCVNAKGFWEDRDLNALNIEMLVELRSDWYHLTPIGHCDVEVLRKKGYFLRAVELLRQKTNSSPVFGFKDPRVAQLLPFWKEVFSYCKFDIRYVLTIRHPLSVAESLSKRDGFDTERSYLLWLGHIITSLIETSSDKRVLVDYDRLMQSPERELKRIAKCAGLEIDPAELESYKTEFLDKKLRHTVYDPNDLLLETTCPPVVREIYTNLLDVASDKTNFDDTALQNKIVRWAEEFERLKSSLMLIDRISTQVEDRDSQIETLNRAVTDRDSQIETLNRAVTDRDGQIETLNRAVTDRDSQIETLNRAVTDREGQVTNLNQAVTDRDSQIETLNQAVTDRDGQIGALNQAVTNRDGQIAALKQSLAAMRTSNSWKLTAPLRWVSTQLRRLALLRRARYFAIRHLRSPTAVFMKAYRVYRREGMAGVGSRIRFLLARKRAILNRQAPIVSPTAQVDSNVAKELVHHNQSVDIIVCVHNALDDVKRCLESVITNTIPPYRLIIVDDGSNLETKRYLEEFAPGQAAVLIRNETATGYTSAANKGLRESTADFVVLLNSDTITTPEWLDRLIQCAVSDRAIGIVGPLSNTASWQSIPKVSNDNGDWAENPLPDGWSVSDFSYEVSKISQRVYPRVGFVNGFCFMIKRDLINDIGLFDEVTFARGYGEENDYCLRAVSNSWQLAIADDCYIYHAQSKSYSHERRTELSRLAGEALAAKHKQSQIDAQLAITCNHPVLEYMRRRSENIVSIKNIRERVTKLYEGKRVLFLLPARTAGGGGNIVILEAAVMRANGVDVWIANLEANRQLFEQHHPNLSIPVVYLGSPNDLIKIAKDFDAVIATLYLTVFWMKQLLSLEKIPVLGYYIQDFEPYFFEKDSEGYRSALESYTAIDEIHMFTKTDWNRKTLETNLGLNPVIIGPSIDIDAHHPAPIAVSEFDTIRISAMVRPSSPRRSPAMTLRILKRLKERYGEEVQITTFGVQCEVPEYIQLESDFIHTCLGELDKEAVARVLRQSDIFIDCSEFQAMGLTAMEAMASGVVAIGPVNGGLKEIITDQQNGILVDTRDEEEIFKAVCRCVKDRKYLNRIKNNSYDVLRYSPEKSAEKMLQCLFGSKDEGARDITAIDSRIE